MRMHVTTTVVPGNLHLRYSWCLLDVRQMDYPLMPSEPLLSGTLISMKGSNDNPTHSVALCVTTALCFVQMYH